MFRSSGILTIFMSLVVLAGLGCANPAENKTEAVVEEPVAETTAPAEGERFAFTDESSVDWEGSKVTGSHVGGFNAFDGEIVLVDGDPTASRVNVVIDTTSLWSDNEKLTNHLKSPDFFEVETYPTATFSSTSIAAGADGYTVTGNLDLHGVTKSISFPASITMEEGRVTATAEFFIQRFDFGIVYPGRSDDLIRDEVVIKLNLVAESAGDDVAEPAA